MIQAFPIRLIPEHGGHPRPSRALPAGINLPFAVAGERLALQIEVFTSKPCLIQPSVKAGAERPRVSLLKTNQRRSKQLNGGKTSL